MNDPMIIPLDIKNDALQRIKMYHVQITKNEKVSKKKLRGIQKIIQNVAFGKAIIYTNETEISVAIEEHLTSTKWRVCNFFKDSEKIEVSDQRIIIAKNMNQLEEKGVVLSNITLTIHLQIPSSLEVLRNDIYITGASERVGVSISIGTQSQISLLRDYCAEIGLPLMPLPSRMPPIYFFMDQERDYDTNVLMSYKNSRSDNVEGHPDIFEPPKRLYLEAINKRAPYVDLSQAALLDFMADSEDDEDVWYEKENEYLASIGYRHPEPFEELSSNEFHKRLEYFKDKLQLSLPKKYSLGSMMNSESWSHPVHKNVHNRVTIWVDEVRKMETEKNRLKVHTENIAEIPVNITENEVPIEAGEDEEHQMNLEEVPLYLTSSSSWVSTTEESFSDIYGPYLYFLDAPIRPPPSKEESESHEYLFTPTYPQASRNN
eukprot:TRINITY_DN3710_c0_g1_i2.p1 TRINITY_DN3710_c0_g1~~TRINITY_DN3710_c0_g1_i2.p1  ORF type:complete len:431 (+),score=82.49 TRINITY_DN3710_c0_g1_i2:577-1869(+)